MAKMILVEKCDGACGYVDREDGDPPLCSLLGEYFPNIDNEVDPKTLHPDCPLPDAVEPVTCVTQEDILAITALRDENEALRGALETIRQCLRDTMPGNDEDGKMDFFILYPTMKPIAEIATKALAGKEK